MKNCPVCGKKIETEIFIKRERQGDGSLLLCKFVNIKSNEISRAFFSPPWAGRNKNRRVSSEIPFLRQKSHLRELFNSVLSHFVTHFTKVLRVKKTTRDKQKSLSAEDTKMESC